ncbi:hypothetical protein GHK03_30870 [Sinorhizobium medicae]|uniref:hypothetical protein n=1 Tax=Sinorhizobium medicae TaxID=110321 RepID=UPI001296D40B|nr:hypothetical protein [Sinorhizobium medicae]MQY00432.1 hypothetical protein [Sinorhizobium medicae]
MTQTDNPSFRVHFHDGKTFDIAAANSLIAEKKARAPPGRVREESQAHPGEKDG